MANKTKASGGSFLSRTFAPGYKRVRTFSVGVNLDHSKNAVKVDWDSFSNSEEVKEQLEAVNSSSALSLRTG